MDYEVIAKQAGCRPEAAEDIVRRCEARFQGEEPTSQVVSQWLKGELRVAAPHLWPAAQTLWARLGMTEEAFNQMPPTWRLTQAYQDPSHVVEDRQARRRTAQLEREAAAPQRQG